jgi:hypothetical protein
MTRHEPSRSSWTRAGEIADHVGPHRRAIHYFVGRVSRRRKHPLAGRTPAGAGPQRRGGRREWATDGKLLGVCYESRPS